MTAGLPRPGRVFGQFQYLSPPVHEARGADKRITGAIDAHVQAERGQDDDDDGTAGVLVPAG